MIMTLYQTKLIFINYQDPCKIEASISQVITTDFSFVSNFWNAWHLKSQIGFSLTLMYAMPFITAFISPTLKAKLWKFLYHGNSQ